MDQNDLPGEEWRTLPGHPDYDVSNLGRIRSHKRPNGPKILSMYTNKDGYVQMKLDNAIVSVHRAVAEAWHGPCPEGMQVDHINRVRDDNRPENLRYLTPAQNKARMVFPPRALECPSGHPYSGTNLLLTPTGSQTCRECQRKKIQDRRNGSTGIPCSVEPCDRIAFVGLRSGRPICEMHYQRERRAAKRREKIAATL